MSPLVPHDFSDTFHTSLKPPMPRLILGALVLCGENKYNNGDTATATSQSCCKIQESGSLFECWICHKRDPV